MWEGKAFLGNKKRDARRISLHPFAWRNLGQAKGQGWGSGVRRREDTLTPGGLQDLYQLQCPAAGRSWRGLFPACFQWGQWLDSRELNVSTGYQQREVPSKKEKPLSFPWQLLPAFNLGDTFPYISWSDFFLQLSFFLECLSSPLLNSLAIIPLSSGENSKPILWVHYIILSHQLDLAVDGTLL